MIASPLSRQLVGEAPAFVTRVRLRAALLANRLRAEWEQAQGEPAQGLAITHAEVDRALRGGAGRDDRAPWDLRDAVEEADERASDPSAAALRLARALGLTHRELDLLTLAAAAEVDPRLQRVYGYLQDNAGACYATVRLAAELFEWPAVDPLGPGCALVRWRLALPGDVPAGRWSVSAPWSVDPAIVGLLLADDVETGRTTSVGVPCLYPAERDRIVAFVRAIREQHGPAAPPIRVSLGGPEGAGKRTLAAQACAELGLRMLAVELDGGSDDADRLLLAARAALLTGGALYCDCTAPVDGRLWRELPGAPNLVLTGSDGAGQAPDEGRAHLHVALPQLSRADRVTLWQHLCAAPPPRPVLDWALAPAEIAAAAQVAGAGADAVAQACRRALPPSVGDLLSPLACPYTWDDIVLPAAVVSHLRELEAQARLRWQVYEEWGYGQLCPVGGGITALFAGPSGTGKTMAAQIIARSLGLDLYRIDLASVVSKYIGETEKNLKQVFDGCERANVLLFFDEADALFGQRTQVRDAHDRYANIEVDYLLQRMERFSGIAILATNRKADIEQALLRRIRFIVDFVSPGPRERLAIWEKALITRAVGGEELLDGIDREALATRLEMTGAEIKNSALAAAFLACSEGVRIGTSHILHAARREMAKRGAVLRSDGAQE